MHWDKTLGWVMDPGEIETISSEFNRDNSATIQKLVDHVAKLEEDIREIKEERDRLREALRLVIFASEDMRLADPDDVVDKMRRIAREALEEE